MTTSQDAFPGRLGRRETSPTPEGDETHAGAEKGAEKGHYAQMLDSVSLTDADRLAIKLAYDEAGDYVPPFPSSDEDLARIVADWVAKHPPVPDPVREGVPMPGPCRELVILIRFLRHVLMENGQTKAEAATGYYAPARVIPALRFARQQLAAMQSVLEARDQ